jgi:hypothetical protein
LQSNRTTKTSKFGAKTTFSFFPEKSIFGQVTKIKVIVVLLDAENSSEHFWSAYLVMKIKIERVTGDQRIFGSKISLALA